MDVGKREDQLLDKISEMRRNRDSLKAWLEIYQEANLISPEISSHLWEIATGMVPEESKV
jgi:hypothetical protein